MKFKQSIVLQAFSRWVQLGYTGRVRWRQSSKRHWPCHRESGQGNRPWSEGWRQGSGQSGEGNCSWQERLQTRLARLQSAQARKTGKVVAKGAETSPDPMNRVAVGLEQGNFQLYEGKQSQEIKHFSREDAPVSLGVILDVSGSMASKIERVREAVLTLLEESNPQDEFFLITFADRMWSRTSPRRSRKCKDSCSLHARRDERRCSMRFIWGWTKWERQSIREGR